MAKVVFASLLGVASAGGNLALTWKDCGDASTHAKVEHVQPSEVVIGQATTITGTGTTDKKVESGTFTMKLTASLGIKETYTGKVCEAKEFEMPLGLGTLSWAGLTCPVAVGPSSVKIDVKLASTVPASLAKADVAITAIDQDREPLLCVNNHLQKKFARGLVRGSPNYSAFTVAEITKEMRENAPDAWDWTTRGAVSPVKDQGQCGCCWAFSAAETVESSVFLATATTPQPLQQAPDLSVQQLVSCDKQDYGCDGGNPVTAYGYLTKTVWGLDSELDYPYTSGKTEQTGNCTWDGNRVVEVTSWNFAVNPCQSADCTGQDEDDLKAALVIYGPLSVLVNAATWDSYSSGVLQGECPGALDDLDHAVQLVGYDSTGSTPYWKVRNSWGTGWGEEGYIRIPMGENACGIADQATYVSAKIPGGSVTV